jgi:Ca-activated chloride channel family protein
LRYADVKLAAKSISSWRVAGRWLTYLLRLSIIALVIIALARPQTGQAREIISGEGVDIALAVDISGSMGSLDFEPENRLEAAKRVIADFVQERPYDQIGLVVFANSAFSQSPPTVDHNVLLRLLNRVELATDLGIEDGTAIGMGLANAGNMLKDSQAKSKVVILLTDGVNNSGQIDPVTAAEAAESLGIKVYTIGMGRPGEVPVPVTDAFGRKQVVYQQSILDEVTLQEIADATGGRYFRAEDTAGLKQIYDEINALEQSQVEIESYTRYQELAAWLLIPALVILLGEILLRKTVFRKLP